MRAIVLCAGRGQRLRPLTDRLPKPLVEVGGQTLLGRHLHRLADAGFSRVVINAAHLAKQIVDYVGDGRRWNLQADVVVEGAEALETGGGIRNALPLLGPNPLLAVNGDIWTDFDFSSLRQIDLANDRLAHLVLVPNPEHNPAGDFGLRGAMVTNTPKSWTFSGIGVYRPELVASHPARKFSLTPLLRAAAVRSAIGGETTSAQWFDTGTPTRLDAVRHWVQGTS